MQLQRQRRSSRTCRCSCNLQHLELLHLHCYCGKLVGLLHFWLSVVNEVCRPTCGREKYYAYAMLAKSFTNPALSFPCPALHFPTMDTARSLDTFSLSMCMVIYNPLRLQCTHACTCMYKLLNLYTKATLRCNCQSNLR